MRLNSNEREAAFAAFYSIIASDPLRYSLVHQDTNQAIVQETEYHLKDARRQLKLEDVERSSDSPRLYTRQQRRKFCVWFPNMDPRFRGRIGFQQEEKEHRESLRVSRSISKGIGAHLKKQRKKDRYTLPIFYQDPEISFTPLTGKQKDKMRGRSLHEYDSETIDLMVQLSWAEIMVLERWHTDEKDVNPLLYFDPTTSKIEIVEFIPVIGNYSYIDPGSRRESGIDEEKRLRTIYLPERRTIVESATLLGSPTTKYSILKLIEEQTEPQPEPVEETEPTPDPTSLEDLAADEESSGQMFLFGRGQ